MTTTYECRHYCVCKSPRLRCAPRDQIGAQLILIGSPPPLSDVDLSRSQPPHGTLERAPRTALRPRTHVVDEATERWEGFWCVRDDRYYTRCTHADGRIEWYTIRDDGGGEGTTARARVLPLRRRTATMRFVSTRPDQAPILVGVSRSRRARPRRGARD
jgi:hypothetical protein